MMEPRQIIGHNHQRKEIQRLLVKDRVPSASIFAGPQGIGKSLLARLLARALLCECSS